MSEFCDESDESARHKSTQSQRRLHYAHYRLQGVAGSRLCAHSSEPAKCFESLQRVQRGCIACVPARATELSLGHAAAQTRQPASHWPCQIAYRDRQPTRTRRNAVGIPPSRGRTDRASHSLRFACKRGCRTTRYTNQIRHQMKMACLHTKCGSALTFMYTLSTSKISALTCCGITSACGARSSKNFRELRCI